MIISKQKQAAVSNALLTKSALFRTSQAISHTQNSTKNFSFFLKKMVRKLIFWAKKINLLEAAQPKRPNRSCPKTMGF